MKSPIVVVLLFIALLGMVILLYWQIVPDRRMNNLEVLWHANGPYSGDCKVSVVQVDKCQYVLWSNVNGAGITHYNACTYCEQKEKTNK